MLRDFFGIPSFLLTAPGIILQCSTLLSIWTLYNLSNWWCH